MTTIRKFSAIVLVVAAISVAATEQQHMSDIKEVRKHVGETTSICGQVTTYNYPAKD